MNQRTSEDKLYAGVHTFFSSEPTIMDLKVSQYVCCFYDDKLWLGIITEIGAVSKDALVNFLHMSESTEELFVWPPREDKCWVSIQHILCEIQQPQLKDATNTGRRSALKYTISSEDKANIQNVFSRFMSRMRHET